MIQSEYHWSDERVLDTPICRLRQIVRNIEDRQKAVREYKKTITEWQTRTLAQFIAATAPENKDLSKSADKIRLKFEGEDAGATRSKDSTPIEEFIEKGSQVAQNAPGSFERLMKKMGG